MLGPGIPSRCTLSHSNGHHHKKTKTKRQGADRRDGSHLRAVSRRARMPVHPGAAAGSVQ